MSEVEPFAPINDLGDFDSLGSWRWLVGKKASARLLTAMGDLFFIKKSFFSSESVHLLDVSHGVSIKIADNWENFKQRIKSPDTEVSAWFRYDFLYELNASVGQLSEGNCYSPIVPPSLGGSYEVANFEQTSWRVHVAIHGQIHEQIKDLPAGTKISEFKITEQE